MTQDTERTQFDYLLNAFEEASQAHKPALLGYGDKRRALYAYVRDLERRATPPEGSAGDVQALRDLNDAADAQASALGVRPDPRTDR